jgi:hypothetical protein
MRTNVIHMAEDTLFPTCPLHLAYPFHTSFLHRAYTAPLSFLPPFCIFCPPGRDLPAGSPVRRPGSRPRPRARNCTKLHRPGLPAPGNQPGRFGLTRRAERPSPR